MSDFVDAVPKRQRGPKRTKSREQITEYRRQWQRNPKRKAWQKLHGRKTKLFKTHGITLEQYDALLIAQDSSCAICGLHASKNAGGRPLHVDHNHTTGKLRALLCAGCNLAIGHAREDIGTLSKMITYLEKHR